MKESFASRLMSRQYQGEITKLNDEITELQRRLTAVYSLCDQAEHAENLLSPGRVRAALKPRD